LGISNCGLPVPAEPADYLRIYSKVLQNKVAFYDYDEFSCWKKYCEVFVLPDGTRWQADFTVMDLDADGIPEVILGFHPGIFLILRYEDGIVYGYTRSIRQMGELKKDGTFFWSGGAGHNGVARMKFADGECERTDLAFVDSHYPESEFYCINGVEATWEEYEAYRNAQDEKENAACRELREDVDVLKQLTAVLG